MKTQSPTASGFLERMEGHLLTIQNNLSYDLASYGLFAILAILIVATFTHYGITWDEPLQNMYGADIAKYYQMLLLHGRYLPPTDIAPNMTLYGGLYDTLAFPCNLLFRHHEFEARHFLNAMVGLLGIIGCWKVARFVAGPAVGFWAALLLSITPRYYGGMFNNPKDIPFAVGYIWSVYFILRFVEHLPRVPASVTIKLGLAIGTTLATRIGGLVLFGYLGLVIGVWLIVQTAKDGFSVAMLRRALGVISSAAQAACIAWLFMLLFWPWAQVHPLTRPFEAMAKFSNYSDWRGVLVFHGAMMKGSQIPRTYVLQWLFMTLPEIVLIGLAIGLIYAVWHVLAKAGRELRADLWRGAILLLAAVFPIAYVILKKSILYNAERHVSFVLAPLACLAAWGGYCAFTSLNGSGKKLAAVSILAYLVFQVVTMARLHPDEYVYFNQFVGGLKGADGLYETDYWGNSYREAVHDLTRYVQTSGTPSQDGKYKVYITYAYPACVSYYFPKNFSLTTDRNEADFFIANTSFGTDKLVDGRVIAKVERFGVPLAVVKELPAAEARRIASNPSGSSF